MLSLKTDSYILDWRWKKVYYVLKNNGKIGVKMIALVFIKDVVTAAVTNLTFLVTDVAAHMFWPGL